MMICLVLWSRMTTILGNDKIKESISFFDLNIKHCSCLVSSHLWLGIVTGGGWPPIGHIAQRRLGETIKYRILSFFRIIKI
jgi:hypothetical protein